MYQFTSEIRVITLHDGKIAVFERETIGEISKNAVKKMGKSPVKKKTINWLGNYWKKGGIPRNNNDRWETIMTAG